MVDLRKLFSIRRNQIIAVIVAVIVVGASIIFGAHSTACSGPATHVSITGKQLAGDPSAYKCKIVTMSGKVFNTDKKGNDNAWQVWTDPENSEGDVIVYYSGKSSISNDDYVKFTGQVGDEFSGQNTFGGDVGAPTIKASHVEKVNRDEAVAPALKTITPSAKQTVSGVTVIITKLEFAANETRLYLQVKNDSSATTSIYDFDTKIVQSGSQVKSKSVYDSDSSSELPSDIVAHTTEKGEIYFQKADPAKPLTITLQGYSQDDYQDLNYTFHIDPTKF
jgi:hypothetical protein